MLKLERLVAFSNVVLAIAITLLVLGLDVPSVHKIPEQQLPEYLIDSAPSVLAYLTSLFLVGMYWLQHYMMCLRPADRVLDSRGVILPKGGHPHGPRQAARSTQRATLATLDSTLEEQRSNGSGFLRPSPPLTTQLLRLAA
jgi:hypothetical protein